jgi:FAD-dependent oxidoreductase domain-containing protein 1
MTICIIGGGAIGCCLAYHLAAMGHGREVTVLEPDINWAQTSATRSAAAFRVQFNLTENIALSLRSAAFFRAARELLSVDGIPADIGYEAVPYLVLSGHDGLARLRAAHRRQLAARAAVSWLDATDLARRVPWLRTEGIAAATLGESDEGWIDPRALLIALRRKAESLGVRFQANRAVAFDQQPGRITEVHLDDGSIVVPRWLVVAAGAWSAPVARMAGVDLPIEPRKRSAFVRQRSASVSPNF